MANVIINDEHLTNIAATIRGKNGTTNTYAPNEMAAAIASLSSGSGGGGELAYATLTHTTGSTNLTYRTFDLSNYITSGTIYFMTQHGSQYTIHILVITDGKIVDKRYGSNGSGFQNQNTFLTSPTFELTNGILKVTGTAANYVKNYADVIYTA